MHLVLVFSLKDYNNNLNIKMGSSIFGPGLGLGPDPKAKIRVGKHGLPKNFVFWS
jgi:hypothetical protein